MPHVGGGSIPALFEQRMGLHANNVCMVHMYKIGRSATTDRDQHDYALHSYCVCVFAARDLVSKGFCVLRYNENTHTHGRFKIYKTNV